MKANKQSFDRIGIVLIVVRNAKGQYLAILETDDRGWWLPGGRVEPNEQFEDAALREALEETGIHVSLKGVLRVEYSVTEYSSFMRYKIVYYAQPINEEEQPKNYADKESVLAQWIDYKNLPSFKDDGPGWRGPELLQWSSYIENGGSIMPLSTVTKGGGNALIAQPFTVANLPFK